ncbi:Replicative DNA helicase (DnaB), partial [hydrothermal vent metagenome]
MENTQPAYDVDQGDSDEYRVAPHNIEAEQALLGAILINNDAFDRIASFLEVGHFYEPLHARIFEAVSKLISGGHI